MLEKIYKRPWVVLNHRIKKGDAKSIEDLLKRMQASEKARALARLDIESIKKLLTILSAQQAARLVEILPLEQAADLLEHLEPVEAAAIVDQLPRSLRADILNDVSFSDSQAILETMSPDTAQQTRQILQYPENTAGGLMSGEYLAFNDSLNVQEVLDDLAQNSQKYSDYNVQYAYIIDQEKKLVGVLQMRDLILTARERKISEIMKREPLKVEVTTTLERLIDTFEGCTFIGIPVVDEGGHLAGVARRYEVMKAAGDREKDTYLKASGIVGGEEFRSMPTLLRSRRRLSWLSVNILLNILSASVIAFYQDTLAAVIALAVFLPIISDMSGCAGNQAVAVSIRELTLGIIKPADLFSVLFKELSVGIINSISLGIILGVVAFLWKGNPYFGLVVGAALALNTLIAVFFGGLIPLLLKKMGKDPALASGPILTTITDMCGFFLALSFATLMLPRLN